MSLLVHDDELADLRSLLEEMGTPFVERRGALGPEDRAIRWDLVIATPKRMLDLNLQPSETDPVQIAILEQDSRTLRNSLRRAGITLIVRRPVHRAALRALIVHSLYRGPEKRRASRVSIGAPVRYRAGWRRRNAILADLSIGGCRLLTDRISERGGSFVLQVPALVAGGRAFSVKARTLKSGVADGGPFGTRYVTARFENVSRRQHELLKAAVAAHTDGPATYAGAGSIPSAGTRSRTADETAPPDPAAPSEVPETADLAPLDAACEPIPEATPASEVPPLHAVSVLEREPDPDALPEERRDGQRRVLEQRVVSLGEEATRVMMGHEMSVGGMRVQPTPGLEVGAELELAIHIESRGTPLVVRARVHRDDGERGLVLRFHGLDAEVRRYLNDLMDQLPVVDAGDDGETYLVTEILATA